jgi:AraC-like DNA-binding protein
MPDHYVSTVFETDIIRIENFHCHGTERSGEETASSHEIVFLRKGVYERRNSFGNVVADLNHILFFHRNQPYQIAHPLPGGDTSTVIAIAPSILREMVQSLDPSVEERPNAPFAAGHGLAEMQHHIRLHRVLRAASAGVEPLEIEENVLILAASAIRQPFQTVHGQRWRTPPTTLKGERDLVNQTKTVIAARFRDKLSLKRLASETFTSPYHLCRVFKRETGLSIHRYLLRLRLLHALDDIAETPGINLTQVAIHLGFSSHSHFTSAFQAAFGIPPSRFARELSGRSRKDLEAKMKPE